MKPPCGHKNTIVTAYIGDGYTAYCSVCSCLGHPYRNRADAVHYLEQQGRAAQQKYLVAYLRDVGFKDPFQLVEKPQNAVNTQENKVAQPVASQPTQTPYWIIVSDEGHAAIPARHTSKSAAEAEARRLTEKSPGKTFTVFQSVSSVFTPKSETQYTKHETSSYYTWNLPPYGYANNSYR